MCCVPKMPASASMQINVKMAVGNGGFYNGGGIAVKSQAGKAALRIAGGEFGNGNTRLVGVAGQQAVVPGQLCGGVQQRKGGARAAVSLVGAGGDGFGRDDFKPQLVRLKAAFGGIAKLPLETHYRQAVGTRTAVFYAQHIGVKRVAAIVNGGIQHAIIGGNALGASIQYNNTTNGQYNYFFHAQWYGVVIYAPR